MALHKKFDLICREGKWYAVDLSIDPPREVAGPCDTKRDAHLNYVLYVMTAVLNKDPGYELE
jgi:hypothetical protein